MTNWVSFWQKESFNGKSENYKDKNYKNLSLSIAKDIGRVIKRNNYNTILDFGCGPAFIIKYLAKKYPNKEFIGYDVSPYITKWNNKTKLKNLHFEVGDLNKIFDKQKFDLVISISTLHYFSNPIKKIKELLSIVNEGGEV